MNKIIVLGSPGSGKSYFSKKLSNILNIPVYHLDNIFWNKNKTHVSNDEFDQKLNDILSKDKWIIDGDYSRTYETRIKSSDTIYFLNIKLDECLKNIESRINIKRDDIPFIETEFETEFKEWVIDWHKSKHSILLGLLNKYQTTKTIITLNSKEEIDDYLKNIISIS